MSRKFDRKHQVNKKVAGILNADEARLFVLARSLKPKPKWVPMRLWNLLQWIVIKL